MKNDLSPFDDFEDDIPEIPEHYTPEQREIAEMLDERQKAAWRVSQARDKTHCAECGFPHGRGHAPDCHLIFKPLADRFAVGISGDEVEEVGIVR